MLNKEKENSKITFDIFNDDVRDPSTLLWVLSDGTELRDLVFDDEEEESHTEKENIV
jgi:hypothetical protein